MRFDFCTTCLNEKIPVCTAFDITTSVTVDMLLNNTTLNKTKYLVCHKNAQSINLGVLNRNEKCDECGLCKIACKNNLRIEYNSKIEKSVLSDLGRLNIFLSSIYEEAKIATEVKTNGNFRQKRIDAVIVFKNNIILVKVLNNLEKYQFYKRAYDDIVSNYIKTYNDYRISNIFLISSANKEKAKQLGYKCLDINEMNEVIKTIGGEKDVNVIK